MTAEIDTQRSLTTSLRGAGQATSRTACRIVLSCVLLLAGFLGPIWAQGADDPGAASYQNRGATFSLGNGAIEAKWTVKDGRLSNLTITDLAEKRTIALFPPFSLLMGDGSIIRADSLHFISPPSIRELGADPGASRLSDRFAGKEFSGQLTRASGDIVVDWSLVLRDGSAYLRQVVEVSAPLNDLPIREIRMIDARLPDAQRSGSLPGAPIVDRDFFLGFENPLSTSQVVGGRVAAALNRELPLSKGRSILCSSVIGVGPETRMRRAFLAYLERERAHPYRTFLHPNSWFVLGFGAPYSEAEALQSIGLFGQELHEKRGVTLDSYLFDDGWDNPASLWSFNQGFPSGFSAVAAALANFGIRTGVWLSPWGGYAQAKRERIEFGQKAGYEIVDGGFALSGPKYYARFREVCLDMIRKYGVNQFKFDGTGNADRVVPGSQFDSDFEAMLHLIGDLRKAEPDLYVNLTTGTYASPFWLLEADSIWRGGTDTGFAGVGSNRERWITYRDAQTYANVVAKGPLFPLSSLMLHGIVYAALLKELSSDPGHDFANEVHSYFGSGTQLQELYITPSLLTSEDWNNLAESAKWSRENAEILKDTHWVGGDPAWLEVYGWASWSPQKSILVLRNPADRPQSVALDLPETLETPANAARRYRAKSPWKADAAQPVLMIDASEPFQVEMKPFQVLTLELTPM